jgi:hypothetical protein
VWKLFVKVVSVETEEEFRMPWILKLSGMVLTTIGYMVGQILLAETSQILSYLPCVPGIVLIHLGFSRARWARQQTQLAPMADETETEQPSGPSDSQEPGGGDPGRRPTPD